MQKEIIEKLKKLKCSTSVVEESDEYVNYPIPGRTYEHYKGGLYKVNHLEKHTENGEILVSYSSITFGTHFARPISVWNKRPNKDSLRFLLQR